MVARRALAVGLLLWMGTTERAEAQVTLSYAANPASLGPIFDASARPGCVTIGTTNSKQIPFDVTSLGRVQSVEVAMTLDHPAVGELVSDLVSPSGSVHRLFWEIGGSGMAVSTTTSLQGSYTFSDAGADSLWNVARATPTSMPVPPGSYRTSDVGGSSTSLATAFVGELAPGTWLLRIADRCKTGLPIGRITAASLRLTGNPAVTSAATPSTLGSIPDGPSAVPQTPGPPRDVTFTIPPGRGTVNRVRLSVTMAHAWVGDLVARLIAPSGESHVLFGYTGAYSADYGYRARLDGTYRFSDDGTYEWWLIAAAVDAAGLPPDSYRTSQLGGPGSSGAVTSMDTVFAGVPSTGVWTLRLTDGAISQIGSISAASLTLETDPAPTTVADAYSTAYATPLVNAAPGVLANDTDNLGGALSAALVTGPARGTLTLAPSGAFTYTPSLGFTGTDSFTYRAVNAAGPGNVATVAIAVAAPTTVQPPTEFRASSMAGNQVTLRWIPAAVGPAARDFVIEGGIAPGQVLGGLAVGGPLPILTAALPTGAFYLRVHAIDGTGQRSGPSNEIPIFVNTAATPSAPATLTGVVNGTAVGLSWRNTFAGGTPTSLQLNVTGAAVASLPLPFGEAFSFAGVPPGTYTFRVRALNASGASLDSNPVTLTFPNGCTGAPAAPPNFLAYALGNVVHLVWDPPASGAAATSYVVTVGGSFTASLPLAIRSFSAPAPSGAYTFTVAAVNSCGTGPATSPQTVFVP